ncbi:MAG: Arc family DNA-binding protein [Candidatus Aminicenantales bacterium]
MSIAITVKNIPGNLYEKLKKRAHKNRRSINSEIISIFDEVLMVHSIQPEKMIAAARALREKTKGLALDEDFIGQAKKEGRP